MQNFWAVQGKRKIITILSILLVSGLAIFAIIVLAHQQNKLRRDDTIIREFLQGRINSVIDKHCIDYNYKMGKSYKYAKNECKIKMKEIYEHENRWRIHNQSLDYKFLGKMLRKKSF